MKHATKHAEELKTLYKKLTRDRKPAAPPPAEPLTPLRALVRGAMSFDAPDERAAEAMARIDREFVDLNELRVATDLELQELIGQRYPQAERRVAMVTRCLNNIFEREHTLNLGRLKEVSKRDARQFLRELPDVHPFVEAYTMLFAFDGHAMPVDDATLRFLREKGIIEEATEHDEAQRFVEHHLKAEECLAFYLALRDTLPLGEEPPAAKAGAKKKAKA